MKTQKMITKYDIDMMPHLIFKQAKNLDHILVSNFGICYNLKTKRYLKPFYKTNNKGSIQILIKIDGKYLNLKRLMYETFISKIPPDYVCYIKNGIHSDLHINNIGVCSKEKLGKKTGGSTRKTRKIFLIDENNNILQIFTSGRIAAKQLYCSYQTIYDTLNGKVKNPIFNLIRAEDYQEPIINDTNNYTVIDLKDNETMIMVDSADNIAKYFNKSIDVIYSAVSKKTKIKHRYLIERIVLDYENERSLN